MPGNKEVRAKESTEQSQKGRGTAEKSHPDHSHRAARMGWRVHGCSQRRQDQGPTDAPRIRPLWSDNSRARWFHVPARQSFTEIALMVSGELLGQLCLGLGKRVAMLSMSDRSTSVTRAPGLDSHLTHPSRNKLPLSHQHDDSRSISTLPAAVCILTSPTISTNHVLNTAIILWPPPPTPRSSVPQVPEHTSIMGSCGPLQERL